MSLPESRRLAEGHNLSGRPHFFRVVLTSNQAITAWIKFEEIKQQHLVYLLTRTFSIEQPVLLWGASFLNMRAEFLYFWLPSLSLVIGHSYSSKDSRIGVSQRLSDEFRDTHGRSTSKRLLFDPKTTPIKGLLSITFTLNTDTDRGCSQSLASTPSFHPTSTRVTSVGLAQVLMHLPIMDILGEMGSQVWVGK
jgi:hypothetical protein